MLTHLHSLDTGELRTLTLVVIVKRSATSILAQLGTVDAVKRPVWGPPCVCTHTPTPSLMPSVSVTEGVSDCCGRHLLEYCCIGAGVLCGECVSGYGVSALLNNCVTCNNAFSLLIFMLSMCMSFQLIQPYNLPTLSQLC